MSNEVEYTTEGLMAMAAKKTEAIGNLASAVEYGYIATINRSTPETLAEIIAEDGERFYVIVKADGRTFCRGFEVSSTARDLIAASIANFSTRH
jgi:hypothetical protein